MNIVFLFQLLGIPLILISRAAFNADWARVRKDTGLVFFFHALVVALVVSLLSTADADCGQACLNIGYGGHIYALIVACTFADVRFIYLAVIVCIGIFFTNKGMDENCKQQILCISNVGNLMCHLHAILLPPRAQVDDGTTYRVETVEI